LDFVLGGEQWSICCGGETGGVDDMSVVKLEEETSGRCGNVMVSKELDGDGRGCVARVLHGLKKEMVELLLTEAKMIEAKLARGLMERR
jgi:hypothetical protein